MGKIIDLKIERKVRRTAILCIEDHGDGAYSVRVDGDMDAWKGDAYLTAWAVRNINEWSAAQLDAWSFDFSIRARAKRWLRSRVSARDIVMGATSAILGVLAARFWMGF